MAPPTFTALGKQAKEILNKGYNFGLWKLDCKTKTSHDIEFSTVGQSTHDGGKIKGSLETKYDLKQYGITISEKWNTDNTLNTAIVFNTLAAGLKVTIEGLFAPQTENSKTGKLKVGYGIDSLQLDTDCKIDSNTNEINIAAVVGYEKWLFFGYQTGYNTEESKVTGHNLALSCHLKNCIITVSESNDFNDYMAYIYHKYTDKIAYALQLNYLSETEDTKFGAGAVFTLDSNSSIRCKINNDRQLGLGYSQKIRDGITLSLCTLIDGNDSCSGTHKIGVALELEA